MYKTVRQGDNCLQYHILPQDDVTTGHVMKRRRSTRHRTAFILVLTVILGCAIVAAAVLIPVLTHTNVVTLPARFQTFAVAASSVNLKGHGKYTLQGTQYIALLPVKDATHHFNAYQIKPSILTTTTTTTTTTAVPTTTTTLTWVRTENNDPYRPKNLNSSDLQLAKRGDASRSSGKAWSYLLWLEQEVGLVLGLGAILILLLFSTSLGLCLYLRRRRANIRRELENDRGTLLAEVPTEED